jgi:hypothetical protein
LRAAAISDSINQMTEVFIWNVLRWLAIATLGVFLARLILRVLAMFLQEMIGSRPDSRRGVWIEANWGGLGGGLSGWRVSNAVIYLLLMTLLLGCLSLAVVSLPPASESKTDTAKKDTQKKEVEKKDGDQKPAEPKTPDAPTAEQSPKKSSTTPADGKQVKQ